MIAGLMASRRSPDEGVKPREADKENFKLRHASRVIYDSNGLLMV